MLLIKRARLVRLSIIFDFNNNKYYLGTVFFVKRNRSVYWNIESTISEYRVIYCKIINIFSTSEYVVSTTPILKSTRNVGAYEQAQPMIGKHRCTANIVFCHGARQSTVSIFL